MGYSLQVTAFRTGCCKISTGATPGESTRTERRTSQKSYVPEVTETESNPMTSVVKIINFRNYLAIKYEVFSPRNKSDKMKLGGHSVFSSVAVHSVCIRWMYNINLYYGLFCKEGYEILGLFCVTLLKTVRCSVFNPKRQCCMFNLLKLEYKPLWK